MNIPMKDNEGEELRSKILEEWQDSKSESTKSMSTVSIFKLQKDLLITLLTIKSIENFPRTYVGKPLIDDSIFLIRRDFSNLFRDAFRDKASAEKLTKILKLEDILSEIDYVIQIAFKLDTNQTISLALISNTIKYLGEINTDLKRWESSVKKKIK